jgi:hypothetical protein
MTALNRSVYKLNAQHKSRTRLQVYFSSPCSKLVLRKVCRKWGWHVRVPETILYPNEIERDLAFSGFDELPPYWSTGSYSAYITSCNSRKLELEEKLWRKISWILCRYNSYLPSNQSRTDYIVLVVRNDWKQTLLPFCLYISFMSSGDSDLEPRKICRLQVGIEFAVPFLGRKFSHWW